MLYWTENMNMRALLWPTDVLGTSLSVCAAHQEWLWQADNRALFGGWCCVEPLCTLGVPGSLWGSGQREKEREKKKYSQLKLAPLSLWQPPFTGERSASQIIYRNRLILPNVSLSLSLSLTHTLQRSACDWTHISPFLPIFSHSRISHTSLCALQCVCAVK